LIVPEIAARYDLRVKVQGVAMEKCGNCGVEIGKLEAAYVWRDNPVCAACYRRLVDQAQSTPGVLDYATARGPTRLQRASVDDLPLAQEVVLYETTLSPVIFASPAIALFLAMVFSVPSINNRVLGLFAVFAYVLAAVSGIEAFLRYRFSEFRVTNKRLMIKVGFLSRRSKELLLQQVESIRVDQQIFDRLFNSGTVTIVGTGGSEEKFWGITRPLVFRREATAALEAILRPSAQGQTQVL
jgi:membrane protein YdbS with pleckstrin-like domain